MSFFNDQVILAGFAEQSKTSVVHMCSLFHAFILCQLWTVYLEQTIAMAPPRDDAIILASSILLDFWGKVTPGKMLCFWKSSFCKKNRQTVYNLANEKNIKNILI